jgi:hypothetical protein
MQYGMFLELWLFKQLPLNLASNEYNAFHYVTLLYMFSCLPTDHRDCIPEYILVHVLRRVLLHMISMFNMPSVLSVSVCCLTMLYMYVNILTYILMYQYKCFRIRLGLSIYFVKGDMYMNNCRRTFYWLFLINTQML